MNESINDLKNCSLFNGLTHDELVRLFELVETESFDTGALILEQGRMYRSVWIILRGTCEVVRLSANGADQQLAVLEPGGIFGEMSFLQDVPHSATVCALSEVESVRITPEGFEELKRTDIKTALKIMSNLVELLSDRLRRMDTWICDLVDQSQDRRQFTEWKEFQSKLYTDWSF